MDADSVNVKKKVFLPELDIVKVFAILTMVTVHVYEQLANAETVYPTEAYDVVIQFLGGPLAAPVFMFAMGVGVVFTKHNRPIDYFRRGLLLLVCGYLLNIVRCMIPYYLMSGNAPLGYMLCVDIFHLAGMSFMLIGLLKTVGAKSHHVLIIALVMFAVSTIVGKVAINNEFAFILGLFLSTDNSYVCFSLFGWFIYIAIGIFVGSYLKKSENRNALYLTLISVGGGLFIVSTIITVLINGNLIDFFTVCDERFYFQSPLSLAWNVSIVLMWISAVYFIHCKIHSDKFDAVCRRISSYLPRLYIMQWVIIGWIASYLTTNNIFIDRYLVIPVALVIVIAVILLCPIYNKVYDTIAKKMNENRSEF